MSDGIKVADVQSQNGGMYVFFCPACQCGHWFNTNPKNSGPCWTFNGDMKKPTIRASILVYEGKDNPPSKKQHRCHSYVTDGRIQFLADCTHRMAGQTVDLPDVFGHEDKQQ